VSISVGTYSSWLLPLLLLLTTNPSVLIGTSRWPSSPSSSRCIFSWLLFQLGHFFGEAPPNWTHQQVLGAQMHPNAAFCICFVAILSGASCLHCCAAFLVTAPVLLAGPVCPASKTLLRMKCNTTLLSLAIGWCWVPYGIWHHVAQHWCKVGSGPKQIHRNNTLCKSTKRPNTNKKVYIQSPRTKLKCKSSTQCNLWLWRKNCYHCTRHLLLLCINQFCVW
jgi:hypothetical protein